MARDRHRGLSSASSIPTCRSWCCRSTRRSRGWTTRCSKPRPISAARRWRAFWLVTVPLSLPGIVAGALLCFIPIVGEFVIPDLLGGSDRDDRADAVDRVLRQPRLAGRLGASPWCCSCILIVPIVIYRQRRARALGGALTCAAASLVQHRGARARPRVPLSADRDPGDLFVQRLAAGHGLGRLVDCAGIARCSATSAMLEAAWVSLRIAFLSATRRDRARHARRARAGARRPLPRAATVLRHDLCAAGDARSDHRAVAAAAVRRARDRARLLDHRDRAHDADHVLRRRDGAVAARRLRPQPGGGRDGPRLPAAAHLPDRDAAADLRRRSRRAGCSPSRCRSTTS